MTAAFHFYETHRAAVAVWRIEHIDALVLIQCQNLCLERGCIVGLELDRRRRHGHQKVKMIAAYGYENMRMY